MPAGPYVQPAPAPRPAAGRRGWLLGAALVLLLLVVAGQTVFLVALNGRLDTANRRLSALGDQDAKRSAALDRRIATLEQEAAKSLDSTAVAKAVLPSVFRVDAGDFSGTAFAVGQSPSGGGTNLITNFHVVSSVYTKGGRDASLQHDSERFPVKIVQVDQANDLALLHSTESFPRLSLVTAQVSPGAPIVVIGAPLGLAQSVTTGVVSAVRSDFPGEGGKTLIQFDAPINPGNSGGPVVDAQKRVVGVATAKASDAEGIGLAIPISVACTSFSALC